MERLLVLVRHGQSEWNLKNLFTGWKDPGLTDQGVAEAHKAGRAAAGSETEFRSGLYVGVVPCPENAWDHPRRA